MAAVLPAWLQVACRAQQVPVIITDGCDGEAMLSADAGRNRTVDGLASMFLQSSCWMGKG